MKEIFFAIFLWFLTWGFFNVYYKWRFISKSYFGYLTTSGYFLISFFVTLLIYKNILQFQLFNLIISFVLCSLIGFAFLKSNYLKNMINNGKGFLLFHVFNILYQQAMVVVFISLMKNYYTNDYKDYYFGILFMLLHIPVIFLKWAKLRYLYLLLTLISGFIFSYLINTNSFGSGLSYLIHYVAYIFIILILKDKNKI